MSETRHARFRATIHYDGTAYAGWQRQPGPRTVQAAFESCLRDLGIDAGVAAAGRTDAGVHAAGQEIAFDVGRPWEPADLERALNARLPDDVWVQTLRQAASGFHPRFQATGRRYEYFVATGLSARSPHRRRSTWAVDARVDYKTLDILAHNLLGRHNFTSLSKAGQPDVDPRCAIEKATWRLTPLGDLRLEVVADRFLHRMVRYVVAVMVEEATGHRPRGSLEALLVGSGDVRPPAPAPASGLYLTGVRYAEGWNREAGVPGLWLPPARARRPGGPGVGKHPDETVMETVEDC